MAPYELLPTSLPLKEMHIEDSKRDHCLGRPKRSWVLFQKSTGNCFPVTVAQRSWAGSRPHNSPGSERVYHAVWMLWHRNCLNALRPNRDYSTWSCKQKELTPCALLRVKPRYKTRHPYLLFLLAIQISLAWNFKQGPPCWKSLCSFGRVALWQTSPQWINIQNY